MAEEQMDEREWGESNKAPKNKRGRKDHRHNGGNKVQNSDVRRLSLPATINVSHVCK